MAGARGSWFPVHGPRHDGPGTPGQVSCSGMEKVLSFGMVTKSLVRFKQVYFDKAELGFKERINQDC